MEGEGEDEDVRRRSAMHQQLDRKRLEISQKDAKVLAKEIEVRYKKTGATRYTGDPANIPQRLLMPSVNDPNLWQVRVKVRGFHSIEAGHHCRLFNDFYYTFLYL
jgi:transcription elongation factor SPT5